MSRTTFQNVPPPLDSEVLWF